MDCLLISGYGIDTAGVGFRGLLGSNMDDNAAREDACREYQSSLEDLTFNSKPHINMLTILAEENLNFAKDIVAIIEAQILKVFINIAYLQFEMFSVAACRRPRCRCAVSRAKHGGCRYVTQHVT